MYAGIVIILTSLCSTSILRRVGQSSEIRQEHGIPSQIGHFAQGLDFLRPRRRAEEGEAHFPDDLDSRFRKRPGMLKMPAGSFRLRPEYTREGPSFTQTAHCSTSTYHPRSSRLIIYKLLDAVMEVIHLFALVSV